MYFKQSGRINTIKTLELAVETAKARGIRHIVIASNSGDSALPLIDADISAVCVTHVNGFVENGKNEMETEMRTRLEASGMKILTATHVLSGAERGISKRSGGMYPVEVIANSLRMFGAGVKVCVEISVMALDAGMIPYGEKIIAVGGTGRGADTAIILSPAHAHAIFDTYIHEIICKPE